MTQYFGPEIELSDWIEALRVELQRALYKGEGQSVLFDAEKVELELKVSAKRESQAGGKIEFKVWSLVDVAADGGGKLEREAAHTIKLTLKPRDGAGGELRVSDVEKERPVGRLGR